LYKVQNRHQQLVELNAPQDDSMRLQLELLVAVNSNRLHPISVRWRTQMKQIEVRFS